MEVLGCTVVKIALRFALETDIHFFIVCELYDVGLPNVCCLFVE